MKVLVACEESQEVCKAFRELGHEAYSCDIQPCSGGHPEWHLQCDVREVLNQDWDLCIAHPECTDLASSGARWFPQKIADGRQQRAIDFFMMFTDLPHIPKVAIENPIGIMSTKYRKPDQIIQPYWFGDPYKKSTCLWLKNLPKLEPTDMVEPAADAKYKNGKSMAMWIANAPHKTAEERRKIRSKTFPGIARAMALTWGGNLLD